MTAYRLNRRAALGLGGGTAAGAARAGAARARRWNIGLLLLHRLARPGRALRHGQRSRRRAGQQRAVGGRLGGDQLCLRRNGNQRFCLHESGVREGSDLQRQSAVPVAQ